MKPYKALVAGLDIKRWAYGWHCVVEGKHYIILDDAAILYNQLKAECIEGFVEVIPESVKRFVCPDKDGKAVFDGDEVECSLNGKICPNKDTVIIKLDTPYLRTRDATLYDWWLKIGGEITLIKDKP